MFRIGSGGGNDRQCIYEIDGWIRVVWVGVGMDVDELWGLHVDVTNLFIGLTLCRPVELTERGLELLQRTMIATCDLLH